LEAVRAWYRGQAVGELEEWLRQNRWPEGYPAEAFEVFAEGLLVLYLEGVGWAREWPPGAYAAVPAVDPAIVAVADGVCEAAHEALARVGAL
jgi:hypothetical protein